jgi:hypothetical protein
MDRIGIAITCFMVLFKWNSGQIFAQNVVFSREKIELDIKNQQCCLRGTYYFQNRSAMVSERMIYYPFSVNYNLAPPDTIVVTDMSRHKSINFSGSEQGILFPLVIPAKGESAYRVIYCQNTPQQKMEYILTSTHFWNRPLDQAEFIIKLAADLQLKYLSISWDSTRVSQETIYYYKTRYHFMPDSNLVVEWTRR